MMNMMMIRQQYLLLLALLLVLLVPILASPLVAKDLSKKGNDSQELVVKVNNELGWTFLQLTTNDDNSFFSPLSLTTTLLALLNAANGETERELRHALNITAEEKIPELNSQLKEVLEVLRLKDSSSESLNLKTLSRILVSNQTQLNEEFAQQIRDNFDGTRVQSVDFANDNKEITRELNEWANNGTNGRIRRLFKDSLDAQSQLVLANAVHFSGQWKHPFQKNRTERSEFHNQVSYSLPGMPTPVHFMQTEDKFRLLSAKDLHSRLIELPFTDDLSMIVVLPNSESELEFVNENMTLAELEVAIGQLMRTEPQPLQLSLPKFKLETDYDLKEPLEELDVKTLFTSADLSRALKDKSRVSTAVQRASIEVTEEGTEAGAATGMELQYLSLPPQIKVDRPFLFVIRENSSGLIAFIGRVQTLVDEELLSLSWI